MPYYHAMADIRSVFAIYGPNYRETHQLSLAQTKVVGAVSGCRTAAMGAHSFVCNECGHIEIAYNSCRNRHCPSCQTLAKEKWVAARSQDLLDISYFHVVFTLPSELHGIVYQNQKELYSLMFKAVSETIIELCADPKYLGATPGITAVLHTWGQNLSYHPHIHCIVTGGGLTSKGFWQGSSKKFFLPVKVLSRKFRGKFLAMLKCSKLDFFNSLAYLDDGTAFARLLDDAYKKEWVVYCKKPFKGVGGVLNYLGRYTHRVAISNNRILDDSAGRVTFKWRDYAHGNKEKVMVLGADEFIRRFLMHVLPPYLRKVRHTGLLAPRGKTARIALCRKLTKTADPAPVPNTEQLLVAILGLDWDICPECGLGHLARASPALYN